MADVPGSPDSETLFGTPDPDNITGLGGDDTIVGFSGADSIDGGSGIGGASGDAFIFIGAAAFSNIAGQLRFFQIDDTNNALDLTVIEGDIDGNSVTDFQIGATGLIAFAATDFNL